MRLSVVISLFTVCSVLSLALPLTRTESTALSLSSRSDDGCEHEICLFRRKKTKATKAKNTANAAAKKAAKPERDKKNKAAGLATKASKSSSQTKSDRKARKGAKKENKAAKAAKAKAKPGYKSHDQKTKDKAKVTFSNGAAKRLDGMGLHGKDRKKAKKYHKDVMKSEMKKNGAAKGNVVATAHKGGTVKNEKNHITAQFKDSKGRNIPSKWTNSKGETKTGEKDQHHVYPGDKKKAPSAWSSAVNKSNYRQAANDAAAKAKSNQAFKEKAGAAKDAGEATKSTISKDDKKAQREAKKKAKQERKDAAMAKNDG